MLPKGSGEAIGFRARSRRARVGLTLVDADAGHMVRVTGARRGTTEVSFAGGSDRVQVTHTGAPGTVRLELAGFEERAPAQRLVAKLRLGRGKVTLAPRWKRLGRRIVARVNGRRRVLRNRAKAPVRVRRVRVSAARKGLSARTKVRARLRGKLRQLQSLAIAVEIRKGGKVIARATRQLDAGSKSARRLARGVPVAVGLEKEKLGGRGRLTARAIVAAAAGKPIPITSTKRARGRVRG